MAGPVDPGFHEFASEWIAARAGELRETTTADYTWQLSAHLLAFFHRHRLSQITVAEVDRYRARKVREGVISAESINKTITRLGQILAVAEERDLIARNPVRVNTRNRKLKTARKPPIYLDTAEQIAAILDAATDLDTRKEARTAGRRGFMATLTFAGLRIHEAAALTWRDVDLARGRITVGRSKTDAGIRTVDIVPVLQDELTAHRSTATRIGRGDFVFPTSAGSRRDKDNARTRVVNPVVKRADELLAERGHDPLPDGVTAHKLRHTFTSILFALGKDPAYVMASSGTPIRASPCASTLTRCAAMRAISSASRRSSTALIGQQWAEIDPNRPPRSPSTPTSGTEKAPQMQGLQPMGAAGFEPATSRV